MVAAAPLLGFSVAFVYKYAPTKATAEPAAFKGETGF